MGVVSPTFYGLQPEELTPEEKVCNDLMRRAKALARQYRNYYSWMMDEDELYGEALFEIAKAINKYPDKLDDETEFLKIGFVMMRNRLNKVWHRAFKTHRRAEISPAVAGIASSRLTSGSYKAKVESTIDCIFIWSEFVEILSPLAAEMVNYLLFPDERIEKKLSEYIDYRNSLYTHGAGVDKVPLTIFAELTGKPLRKVREAREEIRKELQEGDMEITQDEDTNVRLNSVDHENELTSAFIAKTAYTGWLLPQLKNQAKFRGIFEPGMSRSDIIDALKKDDETRGIETQSDLKEYLKKLHEEGQQSQGNGSGEEVTEMKVLKEVKPEMSDGKDKVEPDTNKAKTEKTSNADESVVEDATQVEEIKTKIEPEVEKTSQVSVHHVDRGEVGVFDELLKALRNGESVHITLTRLSEQEFHIVLGKPNGASVESVKPTTKQYKKGSKDWKEEVLSSEFKEFRQWMESDEMDTINKMVAYAKANGVKWIRHEDLRLNKSSLSRAIRKHKNVERYKSEYSTKAKRELVTIQSGK